MVLREERQAGQKQPISFMDGAEDVPQPQKSSFGGYFSSVWRR